ncbi:MAG: hypothetical protein WCH43_07100, partial [Verrucomicrobiota bacterium]
PAGNGDGNIDAGEFLALPTEALRDSNANGTFDRLDPHRKFCVDSLTPSAGGYHVSWKAVPGHVYTVEYTDSLSGTWQPVSGGTNLAAPAGQDAMTVTDSTTGTATHRFYRVKLVQ